MVWFLLSSNKRNSIILERGQTSSLVEKKEEKLNNTTVIEYGNCRFQFILATYPWSYSLTKNLKEKNLVEKNLYCPSV